MQSLIAAQPAALAGTSRRGCRAAVAQKAPSLRPSCAGSPQLHYGRRPTRTAATCDSIGSATSQPPLPLPPRAAPDSAALALLAGFEEDLDGAGSKQLRNFCEVAYLSGRSHLVCQHFPGALGADDFMARLEIALYAYGFSGDNSISDIDARGNVGAISRPGRPGVGCACGALNKALADIRKDGLASNCRIPGVHDARDPEFSILKQRIARRLRFEGACEETVSQFSMVDIAKVAQRTIMLTCFSNIPFPLPPSIAPPARPKVSQPFPLDTKQALHTMVNLCRDEVTVTLKQKIDSVFGSAFNTNGLGGVVTCGVSGVAAGLSLPAEPGDVTQVAERTITDDLQHLISETVDPRRADYAGKCCAVQCLVTGVQVHSWGGQFDDDSPNLEFVAPTSVYVVVNGEKAHLDLSALPSLTPRQVALLARQGEGEAGGGRGREDGVVCNQGGHGTVREMDPPYLYNSRETKRRERARADTYAALLAEEVLQPQLSCAWPSWQSRLLSGEAHRGEGDTSVVIDHSFESDDELDGMWAKLQNKYLDLSGAMPDQGQVQSTEGGSGGSGGSSGASPPPPPTSHVSNSSARTSLAVSPPAAAGAGAPAAAAAAGTASGAEGGEAPPRMGLLARLLRTVSAGKQRRRQGREGKSE
uniref:LCI70 protein n=1 Tax=Chlorella sp. ArM0029B TaxID=1415603 RepID=A0A345AXC3_9CHLO|nr:LCI70 protein [Chlorella sp. ArM0029B]